MSTQALNILKSSSSKASGASTASESQSSESTDAAASFVSSTMNYSGPAALFGRSFPSSISAPRALTSTDSTAFASWKFYFKGYCLSAGLYEVVFMPAVDALKLASEKNFSRRSNDVILSTFESLHMQAYGALIAATEAVVGSTIANAV